jgi:hypothetical protein
MTDYYILFTELFLNCNNLQIFSKDLLRKFGLDVIDEGKIDID